MTDFDEFIGETEKPAPQPLTGKIELRWKRVNYSPAPLSFQIANLIPIPSHLPVVNGVVQGNVKVSDFQNACHLALRVLEEEKQDILRKLDEFNLQAKACPDGEIRTIWMAK